MAFSKPYDFGYDRRAAWTSPVSRSAARTSYDSGPSPSSGFATYVSTASLNSPRTMCRPTRWVIGRTEPNGCRPKKFGTPLNERIWRAVSSAIGIARSGATARSRRTIRNRFPARSPISRGRSERERSSTSMSFIRRALIASGGTFSKEKSCVVRARLSLVPANPIRRRLMCKARASSRTRRFVSQLRTRSEAIVYRPSTAVAGGEEISSTTKSSAVALRVPPRPGVDVRYPSIPTSRSMGLRELLLQEGLRAAEVRREPFGDPLEGGLRIALLHLDRQHGLVELRVARVVQRILDVRVSQEGRDKRIADRVIGVCDLQTNGILLFLEEADLHRRMRSGSIVLRFCGLRISPYGGVVIRGSGSQDGAENHRRGRLFVGELCESCGQCGRDGRGNGAEPEMGTRVRARDGARREESEVVPGHGADLLRRRAVNLTRCGRGLAGHSRTGPKSFPRVPRCVERESPSTPAPTRPSRSSPHGIRTGSNRLSGPGPLWESRLSAKG